jgi:hypothetical protein
VLVTFYVFRFVERLGFTLVALTFVGAANSRFALRRIAEDGLSSFAVWASYDEVPIEGLAML